LKPGFEEEDENEEEVFHHQGFVDAITELLKVRTDAEKLKVQVTETNRRFQDAGKEVIVQTEDIIRCRIQQRNITTVVEKLQLCLPVLEMYSKLKEQMSAKRYYSALKTMEQLENVFFPRVSQYRFCQLMIENLPKLREDIKESPCLISKTFWKAFENILTK